MSYAICKLGQGDKPVTVTLQLFHRGAIMPSTYHVKVATFKQASERIPRLANRYPFAHILWQATQARGTK